MSDGYNTHDLGDLVPVRGHFTTAAGVDQDPDVVKVSIRRPSGSINTYTHGDGAEVVKDSTGHYHLDVNCNATGTWHYRWWSTGDGQAAEEKMFKVRGARAV
jgi:hypothetical protein